MATWRTLHGGASAYLREKRTSPRPVTAQPPAPRAVTRWILSRPETLTEIEQLRLKTILANCLKLDALTGHVRSFAQNAVPQPHAVHGALRAQRLVEGVGIALRSPR